MEKIWRKVGEQAEEVVELLVKEIGIDRIIAQLLVNRGVRTVEQARAFLNPTLVSLHNPFEFRFMEKAVERLLIAKERGERIFVFGDADTDGVVSTAMLVDFLRRHGFDVSYAVSSRKEGFGIEAGAVKEAARIGAKVFISVDCGSSSHRQIKKASQKGMDVIILDHHKVLEPPAKAYAVINPKLEGETYPFRLLAGAGVTFKFIHALKFAFSPYYGKEYVAVDLETTGLNVEKDSIIEIGAVLFKNGLTRGQFQTFVNPETVIPPEVSALHGITNDLLHGAPSPQEALSKFLQFARDRILVGHNIKEFDLPILKRSIRQVLGMEWNPSIFDTLKVCRKLYPDRKHDLQNMAIFFNIPPTTYHRALYDAWTVKEIFVKLQFLVVGRDGFFARYLPLAAIGTLGDVVELLGENRVIVVRGLEFIRQNKIPGIVYMLSKITGEPDVQRVVWRICPVLNAASKMGMGKKVVDFLLTGDESIYEEMEKIYRERRKEMEKSFQKIMANFASQVNLEEDRILVLHSEGLAKGTLGFIANRLVEEYSRPVLVFNKTSYSFAGSARSVPGINIYEILKRLKDFFIRFGGHPEAAGLSVSHENWASFIESLKNLAKQLISKEEIVPRIEYEAELSLHKLTPAFIRELERLRPTGPGNPEPLFVSRNLRVVDKRTDKNERHLFIKLADEAGNTVEAVAWEKGNEELPENLDIIYSIEGNSFEGFLKPRLVIVDWRVSDERG